MQLDMAAEPLAHAAQHHAQARYILPVTSRSSDGMKLSSGEAFICDRLAVVLLNLAMVLKSGISGR